mmetsp:Transcript_47575/g.119088  ORF Transcript_47575/g.119088 Transcript_47575/m.119088 type:complete len:481 (+) Transcript_47575:116-1558(+)
MGMLTALGPFSMTSCRPPVQAGRYLKRVAKPLPVTKRLQEVELGTTAALRVRGGRQPQRRYAAAVICKASGPGRPAGKSRSESGEELSDKAQQTEAVHSAIPKQFVLAAAGAGILGTGLDITGPESTLQALSLLALIVAVHEAGHFAAARLQNIYVTKFSIGFGPTIAKYQGPQVEYSLRAFPLGGFVAFPDDDPESDIDPDDPNLLRNRPLFDRAIVISAGVIANFVFAYSILFTQVTTVGVANQQLLPGIRVPEVVRAGVADRNGITSGDVILKVNDVAMGTARDEVDRLVKDIKKSDGKVMEFEILRGSESKVLRLVPELADDGYGRIGVQLVNNSRVDRKTAESVPAAAKLAAAQFGSMFNTVATGLTRIVGNFQQSSKDVSGPLAIVAVGAEVARNDAAGLFQFAALVNINLGIVNLLPLPALDGGYLALLAVEAVRGGKKLEKNVEGAIMGSGILLLTASGALLVFRDILNLVK